MSLIRSWVSQTISTTSKSLAGSSQREPPFQICFHHRRPTTPRRRGALGGVGSFPSGSSNGLRFEPGATPLVAVTTSNSRLPLRRGRPRAAGRGLEKQNYKLEKSGYGATRQGESLVEPGLEVVTFTQRSVVFGNCLLEKSLEPVANVCPHVDVLGGDDEVRQVEGDEVGIVNGEVARVEVSA